MKNKYKILLSVIIILLIIILLLFFGYKTYKDNIKKNSADVIVDGELSINYFNGKKIEFDDKSKEVKFSVINDSENETLYHVTIDSIKTKTGKVIYTLYQNDKVLVEKNELILGTNNVSSYINIKPGETQTYNLKLNNKSKDIVLFEINIQKASEEDKNFSQIILNDNIVNKESKTKVGEEISVADEGLILDVDDNGNTFYFRGNVVNNYVEFANKVWKIVKINGNGTVKLILDSDIGNSVIYDSNLTGDKIDKLKKYSETKINSLLTEWYDKNLSEYDKYIAQSKYCIDTSMEGENLSNYFRVNISNMPTFNCLGTDNNLKIGLLTIDEIIYAGATINEPNNHFYLTNENNNSWWTLSPARDSVEGLYYYEISGDGKINSTSTGESSKNIRPVINLKKNIEMIGEGTKENPYKLK